MPSIGATTCFWFRFALIGVTWACTDLAFRLCLINAWFDWQSHPYHRIQGAAIAALICLEPYEFALRLCALDPPAGVRLNCAFPCNFDICALARAACFSFALRPATAAALLELRSQWRCWYLLASDPNFSVRLVPLRDVIATGQSTRDQCVPEFEVAAKHACASTLPNKLSRRLYLGSIQWLAL